MAAFVLGNGVSRSAVDPEQLMKRGPVYGCNGLYRTNTVSVLVATDTPIAKDIQLSGYARKNRFYTRRPLADWGALPVPKPYFAWSSGPIAAALAADDNNHRIYLLGFDLGPNENGKFNNVYAGTEHYKSIGAAPTYTGNWTKQLVSVIQQNPHKLFVRIMGSTTARVDDLEKQPNYENLSLQVFLDQLNTGKDL
jgi:hypothetical protein